MYEGQVPELNTSSPSISIAVKLNYHTKKSDSYMLEQSTFSRNCFFYTYTEALQLPFNTSPQQGRAVWASVSLTNPMGK